ncbi:hypothetical protein BDY21DRAFT_353116 [Lineolata rhizophorae]|uniref:Uncharacterized protein n=1 Tax=Lineolata rhizophorae TaxID=578093 RepID=A0A6A6NS11_9PEZI|nr:hypothetical protein BDY21DRAFT_353116 [Lineolata rhizophorae]
MEPWVGGGGGSFLFLAITTLAGILALINTSGNGVSESGRLVSAQLVLISFLAGRFRAIYPFVFLVQAAYSVTNQSRSL